MKKKNLFFKILLGLLLFIFISFIGLIFLSDNPTIEYLKSDVFKNYNETTSKKSIKINLLELDSLILNNPNSTFDLFTYYCGPCLKSIKNGSDFDSITNQKRFYISIDNRSTIEKLTTVFDNNKNISKFYYLEDSSLSGYHFTRAGFIFKKYSKDTSAQFMGVPFYLYSNNLGVIDSSSFGYAEIKKIEVLKKVNP